MGVEHAVRLLGVAPRRFNPHQTTTGCLVGLWGETRHSIINDELFIGRKGGVIATTGCLLGVEPAGRCVAALLSFVSRQLKFAVVDVDISTSNYDHVLAPDEALHPAAHRGSSLMRDLLPF